MGEENRGSSGSSTAIIVIAILGVVVLLSCCGVVAVVGAGFIYARSAVRNEQMEIERSSLEMQTASDAMSEQLHQEMKLPGAAPEVPPPEIAPVPPPAVVEDKKE